jgi:hypothetical protein
MPITPCKARADHIQSAAAMVGAPMQRFGPSEKLSYTADLSAFSNAGPREMIAFSPLRDRADRGHARAAAGR